MGNKKSNNTCSAVEKKIDNILRELPLIRSEGSRSIEESIEALSSIKAELEQVLSTSEIDESKMLEALGKVREAVRKVAGGHRAMHLYMTTLRKAINENFTEDYGSATLDSIFSGADEKKLLNEVICQHMYRHGLLEVGEILEKESGIEIQENIKQAFIEIHNVQESLKKKNLGPAFKWAEAHSQALIDKNSSLEFNLHRLHYLKLISQGSEKQMEALTYARECFPSYISQYETDFLKLMGVLAFPLNGVFTSPYKKLFDPSLWTEISDIFMKDAYSLLGFSVESPLSVCVNAGCLSLPASLNIKQGMSKRQAPGMCYAEVDIPAALSSEYWYHSVFCCPILKQQESDEDPPMKLVCGHVISRDALNLHSFGNKLECPICQLEQNPSEAKQLYF